MLIRGSIMGLLILVNINHTSRKRMDPFLGAASKDSQEYFILREDHLF